MPQDMATGIFHTDGRVTWAERKPQSTDNPLLSESSIEVEEGVISFCTSGFTDAGISVMLP